MHAWSYLGFLVVNVLQK
uniref:Uncharacterized protein n=1 Tax=Moniliophthora roreri TaxID=221103 RepID=A0A0W0FDL9_MONRR